VEPNITDETFVNPLPEIVTVLPPAVEPEFGDRLVTTGPVAEELNVKTSPAVCGVVPWSIVMTVMSTDPSASWGAVAVTELSELTT
jgi:hypothetical protein